MKRLLLALLLVLVPASYSGATVTTTTRTQNFDPSTPTTVFAIDYHFIAKDDLLVVHTTEPSTETTFTRGIDYTVRLPVGALGGQVTLTNSITTGEQLDVTRVMPVTQTTSFRNQGNYSAQRHEDAFDKLTMIAQQLQAAAGTDGQTAVDTHVGNADDHTQYLLLAGRSGGQSAIGGTGSGDNLTLRSSSHATKGKVIFGNAGTTAYDEVNERLGIATATPTVPLDVVGQINGTTHMELGGGACVGFDCTPANDKVQVFEEWTYLSGDATGAYLGMGEENAGITYLDANDRFRITGTGPANTYVQIDDAYVQIEPEVTIGALSDPNYDLDVRGEAAIDTEGVFEGFNDAAQTEASISFHKETGVGLLSISTADAISEVEDTTHAWINMSGDGFGGTVNKIWMSAANDILVDNGTSLTVEGHIVGGGAGATVAVNTTLDATHCGGAVTTDTDTLVITIPDTSALHANQDSCTIWVGIDDNANVATSLQINRNATSAETIIGTCIGNGATPALTHFAVGTTSITLANPEDGDGGLFIWSRGLGEWVLASCHGEWS